MITQMITQMIITGERVVHLADLRRRRAPVVQPLVRRAVHLLARRLERRQVVDPLAEVVFVRREGEERGGSVRAGSTLDGTPPPNPNTHTQRLKHNKQHQNKKQ